MILRIKADLSLGVAEHYLVFDDTMVRIETHQFPNREALQVTAVDAKGAVGAQQVSSALAISKSEASVVKQIDQISLLISTANNSLDEKIDDLKARMDRGEGHTKGIGDGWGYVVGAIGLIAGIAGIVAFFKN